MKEIIATILGLILISCLTLQLDKASCSKKAEALNINYSHSFLTGCILKGDNVNYIFMNGR